MPNRLANETSPYLLQHANNPVDWYPWGEEAMERSRRDNRPIFLSIGYSACHWCHVMEHESFENEEIARLLNDRFVCIKVDREERPDLDQVYMNAVQLIAGRGGWPMSVFLTPDLKPFFGGTYWPPKSGRGMPGFDQVILAVADAWENRRQLAMEQADELTNHLKSVGVSGEHGEVSFDLLYQAAVRLEQTFDYRHGGFGGAPKFPHPIDLQLLLRVWKRTRRDGLMTMVRTTLDKMARGGIYDHLGGGFARYSVDERWLVPHFEKMLYDNALLSLAYVEAFQASQDRTYARVAAETLDYVLNYMTDPDGGFHSTEDADSEGEEGKFYVWTPEEIIAILGEAKGQRFNYVYDLSSGGNFEGHSILNMPKTLEQCATLRGWNMDGLEMELERDRKQLLEVRDRRVRPGKDDKVLVSWNGLMIDALARAAGPLNEPKYFHAATRAAQFIDRVMRRSDGRLLHSYRGGVAKLDAYLDDYVNYLNGLISLYEAGFDEYWIDVAVDLANIVLARFSAEDGGFYFTANDHEQLITRNKDYYDSSVPSSNGMAALALARLGRICGRQDYLDAARRTVESAASSLQKAPTASAQLLLAAEMLIGHSPEFVLSSNQLDASVATCLAELHKSFIPNRVVAFRSSEPGKKRSAHLDPIFAGKRSVDGEMTLYVCENFRCDAPAVGLESAVARIREAVAHR